MPPANFEKVQLTPLPSGEWQMQSTWGKGQGNGNFPRFKLDKDAGPHIISFEIVGGPANVTFKDKPIAVKANAKPQPGDLDSQISWAPGATAKKLWVVDMNTNPAADGNLPLNYVLYFNNFKDLDPIIDNGGTTRPPPSPPPPPPPPEGSAGQESARAGQTGGDQAGFDWTAAIIGLVIGLIIGLVLCWWRRKSAERPAG